jgi:plastocyanin
METPSNPASGGSRRNLRARLAVSLIVGALAAVQLACGAGTESNGGAGATSAPPVDGAVRVDAQLFGFTLSSETAAAGPVNFAVVNDDFLPHDFRIRGNGVDEQTQRLQPGDEATLTVDLAPGTYTYMCTVEGHSENMQGTFVVE